MLLLLTLWAVFKRGQIFTLGVLEQGRGKRTQGQKCAFAVAEFVISVSRIPQFA